MIIIILPKKKRKNKKNYKILQEEVKPYQMKPILLKARLILKKIFNKLQMKKIDLYFLYEKIIKCPKFGYKARK